MRKDERKNQTVPLWLRVFNFLLTLTFRQVVLILLAGVIFAGGALTATKTLVKPVYTSTVTIAAMNERAPNISHIQNLSVCYQLADSIAAAGRNQEAAAGTIARLGLDMDVNTLLGKVRVSRQAKTMLVRVRAVDTEPERAQEIAQVYSEELMERLTKTIAINNPQWLYGPTVSAAIGGEKENTLFGGIFGCLLMLCIFYRKHRSTRVIRKAEDLNQFGKPLIGEISKIRTAARSGMRGGTV